MDIVSKIENQTVKGYRTLKYRLVYEGAAYHVTQRAPGREVVFIEDGDYLCFLKILKDATARFNLEMFSFVLMPNHIHLLFQIKEKNLSLAMKNIFERYAAYFNKKYQRKGHVFCGRFRASLCNDSIYLTAASIYIHLNPLKANLSNGLRDYRWSSLSLYMGDPKDSFVKPERILSVLHNDLCEARRLYNEILIAKTGVQESSSLDRSVIKQLVCLIGGDVRQAICGNMAEKISCLIDSFIDKKYTCDVQARKAKKYIVHQLMANGLKADEITKELGISRATYYRLLR